VRAALKLLRGERVARLFFAALTQSSLGTGAAYVALLLIAYERFRSPWAISLILLADFVPVMILGPIFGAAADRWSRRWCVVTADIARALAFIGIALVHDFGVTLALAVVAGAGTALFRPAALAALPGLVSSEVRPAAVSLFSAVTQVGWTVGPAVAAAALLVASPETVAAANGVTFAVSALILVRLPLDQPRAGGRAPQASVEPSLLREGLSGVRAVAALVDIRIVILVSAGAMFFGGVFNVAEPLFATQTLGSGKAGYSILVAIYGLGFITGSLAGSHGGEALRLRRRYLQGLALTGVGSLCTAVAPTFVVALLTFALAGVGNGVLVVHERLLIQERVPEGFFGRAFGLTDTLVSWSLVSSFLVAGVVSSLTGPRGLILGVAIGELSLAFVAAIALHSRAARSNLEAAPQSAGRDVAS
jgi:MFS family permease